MDFNGVTCQTILPAGSAPGDLSIPSCNIAILDDILIEPHETFSLSASIGRRDGPAQFTTGGDSATVEIIDDDGMLVRLLHYVLVACISLSLPSDNHTPGSLV